MNTLSIRLLGLVARVRPDERRDALGAFLTLFAFMAGHALLETARDALFLASIPARRLPWVYLIIAILAIAIGQREPRVIRKISARHELSRWMVLAGLVTLGFWVVAGGGWDWVYYALYVWSGVLASLVVVRFWTVLGNRFSVTQAKRVFPVIASGSVAGAIAGSALARALTEALPARHLVLAAAAVFFLASRAPVVLGEASFGSGPRRRADADLGRVARMIWSGPYLLRVTAMVLLATVTFTLVDYVFKSAAGRYVPAEDLGEFFSSVYLTLNLLSLVIQVLVVAWLLRHLGLVVTVAAVPAVFLVATLGFAVGGGLTLALVLKGADGTLRHSLYRTGAELLFIPLSDRLRTRVKGVIDVLGQRGGQALASVLILMVLSITGRESVFAAIACLTAVAWLVVALGLREHYLNLFRETLHRESGSGISEFPTLDMASLETLLATLNAPDDRRVVAALEVLRDQDKAGVIPALILYHPSPLVVERALDVFVASRREDALPLTERLLPHPDARVRAATVRARLVLKPDRPTLEACAADPDPGVALTARTGLVALGLVDGEEGRRELSSAVREAGADTRVAVARVIQALPHPVLEPLLQELLADPEPAVVLRAVAAAREMRSPALMGPLLLLLTRRAVREEARVALAAFGPPALARLGEALLDPDLPHAIRRHVPGAIGMIGSAQAPELLLRHLRSEPDGMIRFKVLRALGRWRNSQPDATLDGGLLQETLGQALNTGFRLMGWRRALVRGASGAPALQTELHQILIALLADKQDHTLERVFRLLNLQTGSEEFQRVYRGLHSPREATRAGSRELLEHLVLPQVRGPLLTLVDDLHGGMTTAQTSGWQSAAGANRGYAKVLEELVVCGMESVSTLASAHAAELGFGEVT
ncbi:MAG TPA: Npt1/Npt2 family nucleotide transporter [Longimicrobiales bacterium]|nr:Npt1/Npt2 family nucleotide transporter [Longimicrobiales bacterium]